MQTHLSKIVEPLEGKAQIAGLRAVSFENDGFVKPEYGEELLCSPYWGLGFESAKERERERGRERERESE